MGSKGTLSSGKKSLGRDSACCNSEQLWDVRVLGFFSTCFPVTWFLTALQSLSFSDCCPWHYVLLTKLLGRSQAPSFCPQSHGPGQGLEGEFSLYWQEQDAESSLLAVSHPPKLPEKKIFCIFCLLLALVAVVRQQKQGILWLCFYFWMHFLLSPYSIFDI